MNLEEMINRVTTEEMNDPKIHSECFKVIKSVYPEFYQPDMDIFLTSYVYRIEEDSFSLKTTSKYDSSVIAIIFDKVRMLFATHPLDISILDQLGDISKKYYDKWTAYDHPEEYLKMLIEILKFNNNVTDPALKLWLELQ